MHKFIRFNFLITLLIINNNIWAHDFWLEADPYLTDNGKTVEISVIIGNELVGDSLPNIPNWYSDFTRFRDNTRIPIEGELGSDPAGHFKPEVSGTHIIGYQSDLTNVTLDPDTFLKYLKMEGLDKAILYREKNQQTQQPGKEDYFRHAKTLIQSGQDFSIDDSSREFGFELEIIPQQNPYQKKINEQIDFKVLYQGKAEHDIMLIAFSKANPTEEQRIRTDRNGLASITLNQKGIWLVKAVKIFRIQKDDADWQSHWASLTFEVITK